MKPISDAPPRVGHSLYQRSTNALLLFRRNARSLGLGLVGNSVFAGCQWLIIVVIAQWSSPKEVGQYSLAVVLTTPIVVATNLQLRNLVATGTSDDHSFRQYLTVRLATVPVDFALVALILLIGPWGLGLAAVAFALLLAKEAEAASDLMYGYMLRAAVVRHMARSLALRAVLGLGCFMLAMTTTASLPYSLLALAVAWAAVGVGVDAPSGRRHGKPLPPSGDPEPATAILRHGLPLGLSSLTVVIGVSVPRLFVEGNLGTAQLGIYTALAFTVTGGAIVVNSMCQILLPRLASDLRELETSSFWSTFRSMTAGASILGLTLILLALAFGREFLRVAYGEVYAAHSGLLLWLLVGATLTYVASVVGWALIAARRSGAQLRAAAVGTASIIALSAVLVPRFGLRGAAWATAIGMAIQALAGGVALTRFVRHLPTKSGIAPAAERDEHRAMAADQ